MGDTQVCLDTNQKFQALFENNPNPIYLFDLEGRFLRVNRVGQEVLGLSEQELLSQSFEITVVKKDLAKAWKSFRKACRGESVTDELAVVRNGKLVDLHITKIPVFENGVVTSVFVVAQDISQRIAMEMALQESEERYRSIVEGSPIAIMVHQDCKIVYTNQAGCKLLGVQEPIDLLGRNVFDFIHPDYIEVVAERVSYHGDKKSMEEKLVRVDGEILTAQVIGKPITFQGMAATQLFVYDITEQKRSEALIQHMAYHDPLTNLPNRNLFREQLQSALFERKAESKVATLFVDLDHFKLVNDSMGHSTGDDLLIEVAERLKGCLSETDTLSRIGGDEFIVLLPNRTETESIIQVANRIIESIKEPYEIDGQLFFVTCSIGIAISPDHGEKPEDLMQNADAAMYLAKENGKNNYQIYDFVLNKRIANRLQLERAMRKALQDHEFTLHYQPQVNTFTGEIYGAEALIRWVTPDNKIISPADFIPLAEETGLIVELGEWVLRQTFLQAKEWSQQGLPAIRVSANLSARQFQDPCFLMKLKSMIEEIGVDPAWLGLEITESIIMKDVKYAIQTLVELRKMGFEISIDDFGTGYSSLGFLKTFPIDKLKIDQTFIRDLTTSQEDKAITRTIIALAKNLGLKVIAEGVETEAHVQLLRQECCDELQGYFFSEPVTPLVFESYFNK